MSDEIGHFTTMEQSYIAEYVYDIQWFKNVFIFDGCTMNNRYLVSQIGGTSYFGNDMNESNVKIDRYVIDYGRGNRPIENFQNTPYHIGSKFIEKTGLTTFKQNDPITQNALSGAGIWGTITSNDSFNQGYLNLSDICRYPKEHQAVNSAITFDSVISERVPTEEEPIEIIIDISNRPICAFPGCFIQFDRNYVGSDFKISFDVANNNTFTKEINVTDNMDIVWYYMPHQNNFETIYKIKIIITKALYIENLKYQNSGYIDYEIEYNPDKKIGICNIGMVDSDFVGRTFLGECGGNVYGDLILNKNSTIKNVPTPLEETDVVNKEYVDSKLSTVYRYKGTIDYYFELPQSPEVGDVYNIRYASGENYEEKPMLYSNYIIEDATIPPFSETGLEGFYIDIEYDSKPAFLNGETLDIGVYSPILDSTMTNFKVPILDSCPDPATSGAFYGSGYVTIFVVKSEAPFSNAANSSDYDTRYDEIYDYIINHPWSPNEKPLLDFGEIKYEFISPIAVNDGDNVAWTGSEWDKLASTVDLSNYAEKATTLEGYGITDTYTKDEVNTLIATGNNAVSSIILNSSTPGSTKQFKITIDDNGSLTATELEGNE